MRNKKNLNVLIETLKEFFYLLKSETIKELGKIAVIIQIVVPVVLSVMSLHVISVVILVSVFLFITEYVKKVSYKLNNVTEQGIPIPPHRLTEKDDYGVIKLKEEEVQEAILYLYDIEEYFNSRGIKR